MPSQPSQDKFSQDRQHDKKARDARGRLHAEIDRLRRETKSKFTGYISAALALVAGLAWNTAVSSLISAVFPSNGNSLVAKFVYAIGVTIIITILIVYLEALTGGDEKK